jgi:hypothetical protein
MLIPILCPNSGETVTRDVRNIGGKISVPQCDCDKCRELTKGNIKNQ